MSMFGWFGIFADLIGVVGGIYAFLAWYRVKSLQKDLAEDRKSKNNQIEVKLRLIDGKAEIQLPVELRREELTRAELLGRIGMMPMKEKGKRFSIEYLSEREFLRKLYQLAISNKVSELIIPCSKEELEQFDITPIFFDAK
jgi:hypothetical protein